MELPGWVIGYLYGWWPRAPLTLVVGLIAAVIAAWFIHEMAKADYDADTETYHYHSWCWPATILAAIPGFLLWPLVIIVIILLIIGFSFSSACEEEDK
jgi:hypothetical protein